MQITGIILAGGKSRRMGKDKAFLEFEGKTLLNRAVEFCQTFCSEIIISSNSPEHKIENLKLINDEIKHCGPLGGIYSCLKQTVSEWNFVISVDSPFVESDFISFLYSKKGQFNAVVPVHKKGKEPLIALYHKNILPEIKSQIESGNYRVLFLLDKVKTNFVDSQRWIEKYPKLLINVNYPDDLQAGN